MGPVSENLESHAMSIAAKLIALEAAIDEAMRAVAEKRDDAMAKLEPWLDKRKAAEYLSMAVSTLEGRMASRNPPPHTNDGGKVRFKPSELDTWMRQWTVHYRQRNRQGK
jgi:excisionase family DNA binding protein